MALDLQQCSNDCITCIRGYKGKHKLEAGESFDIRCDGITDHRRQLSLFSGMNDEEQLTALSVLDPVEWAIQVLDWHCLDPDGAIWKRKNPAEYQEWVDDNPGASILGKSRYHRPYQAEMLRCSAKYKIFRIGRQAGKTEAIVVSILYHMFTQPNCAENEGFEVCLVAPMQTQIEVVFNRIYDLISSSPLTASSIQRSVKAPNYSIKLHNKSEVRGFTAGTKSGGDAQNIRGQHAHMLIFDEADYLSSGDLDSAMAITTNFPKAHVWMSSTPSGRRERFYHTCFDKTYREFYYPSSINPMFTDETERQFRTAYTEIGYQHEVLAEFGEQEEGVFQNTYVQNAKRRFQYGEFKYYKHWTYTFGVDWNDTKNGSCIAVVGFDPSRNKFVLVDRHTVSRDGWTQLAACQKVAELNRIWHPMAIYVDSGFGGTQFEILRKYGFDSTIDGTKGPNHPDAKLKDIVKQYKFGSTIEVRDLFTKQPVKKPAKSFLVESTVRRFESGDFIFPEKDDLFERQLLGYVVKNISQSGVPIYAAADESAGDHVLDSVMCALVAFVLESSPFGQPQYATDVAFSGYFGDKLTPLTGEGDLIIQGDLKQKNETARDRTRPTMARSEPMRQQTLFADKGLPAGNLRETSVKLWDPSGFNRDEPKPGARGIPDSANTRKRLGFGSRRSRRPSRKHI